MNKYIQKKGEKLSTANQSYVWKIIHEKGMGWSKGRGTRSEEVCWHLSIYTTLVAFAVECYHAAFLRETFWYDKMCRSDETLQSYAQVVLFTCYAFILAAPCLNSLIYLYPEDLTEGKDGGKGRLQFLSLTLNHLLFLNINTLLVRYYPLFLDTMYIMTDFVYSITSCSRITSWEFSHWKSGYIDFMVWRPTGNKYKLVAFNSLYVSGTFQICTMTTSFVRIFHFALITL